MLIKDCVTKTGPGLVLHNVAEAVPVGLDILGSEDVLISEDILVLVSRDLPVRAYHLVMTYQKLRT